MRTLQEKYNGINEGKFTKDQFLRDARMAQPSLVTQYNGYDDAVQILKNRGMIQETYSTEESFKDYSNDALADMISNSSRFEGNEEGIARVKAELARRKKTSLNEARLTNKSLTDYRYKPTNDMDKYPYEQILRGLRVELEGLNVLGTPTPEEYTKALGKVLKNLEKDSIFYTNQVAGVKANAKRTDLMIDATPKNEIDKENGLKKASLKEAIKGVIKNILTEGNEFGEGEDIYEMQGPKEDSEYKSELADYLDDNQIYGYTDYIHDLMTGPDEDQAYKDLAEFLDGEGIYGYTRAIERIYADYPYDQHWQNQPDEDEVDDISHPRGYEEASDEESFEDLFEVTDTEADKAMVRKFMTMYETEPSKFERLHKQAQTQAATNKDIKYKHLLSLINRAKAGALQSLSNQDKYQASIEGMDESISLKDIL
jgi:hypothetical protein